MVTKNKLYGELDNKIKSILLSTNGWLVGGSIEQVCNDEVVSDYDIIVPNRDLYRKMIVSLCSLFHHTINNYGGFKFVVDGIDVDIWCEELSHFIDTANKITYVYNHKSCILFKTM